LGQASITAFFKIYGFAMQQIWLFQTGYHLQAVGKLIGKAASGLIEEAQDTFELG
jgi:hypothetical protein